MSRPGKGLRLLKLLLLYVVDEIADVGTGDKCFARTAEDDRLDRVITLCQSKLRIKLIDGDFIEGVHSFRTVDGDESDTVIHLVIDILETEWFAEFTLLQQNCRHGEIRVTFRHCLDQLAALFDGQPIHYLERSLSPSQSYFGTTVCVFH